MDRYLRPGQTFSLEDVSGTFEVRQIIGRGASCVVYRTYFYDQNGIRTEHLMKEYNPKAVELYRDEYGALHPASEEDSDAFQAGFSRFQAGFAAQLCIRQEYPELTNSTSNIERIYTGNGTKYISMPWFEGEPYSNVQEPNLYQLLQHMKAIARVVGGYHGNGFLHLDIKPENIYVLPETAESVMLFDFDSVVKKEALSGDDGLSYTKTWAAPEQVLPGRRHKICEATDIYAIGEIFFYQLMGRHPDREERRSFAQYQYDLDGGMLKNVNPQILPILSEVFSHTICTDVSKRYQSVQELIGKLEELLPLADPKAPYLIGNLPPALPSFVGRSAAIQHIHQQLQEHGKLFLSGIGGIGKSELAKQYARSFPKTYDIVLFARCTDTLEALFASDSDIPIVHISPYAGEPLPKYSERKRHFFRDLCSERTLLIIDNLSTADDPLLPELLKLNCHVLITTRIDFSEYDQPQLTVDVLDSQQEIETVFQNSFQRELTEQARQVVRELIQLVDRHTMAVELLAKQMRASELEPEEMLERLRFHGVSNSGHEKIRTGKDGDFSRRSAFDHIRTLFNVAVLDERQQDILANMSLLPYTGIAKRRMREWCQWEDYEVLNQLVETGWVKAGPDGVIALHPLVAEVAMERLKATPQHCHTFLKNCGDYLKSSRENMTAERRRADAILAHEVALKVIRSGIATKRTAFFLDVVHNAWKGFGFLETSIRCGHRALDLLKQIYGENSSAVAQELNNLAVLYDKKGCLDIAEDLHLQSLAIRLKYLKNNPAAVAESYSNLGKINNDKGHISDAERYYKDALKIYQDLHERGHLASVWNGLGVLYSNSGNLPMAKNCYQKAIEIREQLYSGKDHPHLASSWLNLGSLYAKDGNLKDAEAAYQQALLMFENWYGKEHDLVAVAQNNLGSLYKRNGDTANAEACYQAALTIRKKLYGSKHPSTLICYHNLASLYLTIGKYDEAEQHFGRVLDTYRALEGATSPNVADVLSNLGVLHQNKGETAKAESFFRESKRIYESLYPVTHPDIARVSNALGNLAIGKGDLCSAETYLHQAYVIREALYGKRHPITANSIISIGKLFYEKGNFKDAEAQYLTVLDIRRYKFGERHPQTAEIVQKLGGLYLDEGHLKQAEDYINEAYSIIMECYGPMHDSVASILAMQGTLKRAQGDLLRAEEYYFQAKNIYTQLHGQKSISIAKILNNFAVVKKDQRDLLAAENSYWEALDIYEMLYGKNGQNPSMAATLNNLGALYEEKQDYAKAKDYYGQALEMRRALFGDHNKNTAASWGHYGFACSQLGDFSYGEACCQKEISTVCDLMGPDHIRASNAFHRIGRLYAAWGKEQQARDYLSKALRIRQEKLGESNPDTMETKVELEKLK